MRRRWLALCVAGAAVLLLAPGALAGPSMAVGTGPAVSGGPAPTIVVAGGVHPAAARCSSSSLCPAWVRTAYNFTSILSSGRTNGTGQTIVIVDACGDPSIASDLTTFDVAYKLPNTTLTVIPFGTGKNCRNSRWSLETSLDVEWAHAMAPGASIDLIVTTAPTSSELFGAWGYALTNSLGAQISNSWDGKAKCLGSLQRYVATAKTDRVTLLASSGDGGSWGTGPAGPFGDPADCSEVIAVGGTALSVGSGGAYAGESAWAGSGGGYVYGTHEPAFQRTANIPDPSGVIGKPDVAAVADPSTGVWVYNSRISGWAVVGGTSVACPIWAALIADANSERAANGFKPLGEVGPYLYDTIYGVNGTGAKYGADFHDITTGSNGYAAGVGWDPATGLGSMNAAALVKTLGGTKSA